MKKTTSLLITLFFFTSCFAKVAHHPDTVSVGVYINSVHDINFRDKQYTINLWLWLKYKKAEFDFSKYLEVPMAKTVDKSFYNMDTLKDGRIYMLMKLQCLMKDSWQIHNFPFDRQTINFTIENSQYDSNDLLFVEDTLGKHYSQWTTSGWNIIPDSFKISTMVSKYETSFGDPDLQQPHSEFSTYKVQLGLERKSWGLFLKLFLGMYISFLLSFLCFFIHNESAEARFSLSVGSLFAVIGNKYVIDSSLPESSSFTLVDTLHSLTLFFVFTVVACSVYSLKLIKTNKLEQANRFDSMAARTLVSIYIILNVWFIYNAYYPQSI